MTLTSLFANHIAHVTAIYERALAELAHDEEAPSVDAVLIHSGSEGHVFGDDRHITFEAFGHFLYWVPLNRPDQMVLMRPGQKPVFFQVVPTDFWYEQTIETESWWYDCFEVVNLDDPAKVIEHLGSLRKIAFLGENTAFAADLGLPTYLHNERHLSSYLDFYRGMKTEYEVTQIREANRIAMIGHEAARQAFIAGESEYGIHQAFLAANQMIEHDSPYTNIVGLDRKTAILHYQGKRRLSGRDSKVMLIDAGCRVAGYASDITRTYCRDTAHPVFKALIAQVEQLELDLVDVVRPGLPYPLLQEKAHEGILNMLLAHGIVKGPREELEAEGISKVFFPHGIGHLLGLQVHDVGGYYSDDKGSPAPPPENHKFLRLNRQMEKDMVFTIEPGLYFIPVLLDPERKGERSKYFNWALIDELIPLGGIRIEDNILVTETQAVNLTRA